jgi:hypothetical protein
MTLSWFEVTKWLTLVTAIAFAGCGGGDGKGMNPGGAVGGGGNNATPSAGQFAWDVVPSQDIADSFQIVNRSDKEKFASYTVKLWVSGDQDQAPGEGDQQFGFTTVNLVTTVDVKLETFGTGRTRFAAKVGANDLGKSAGFDGSPRDKFRYMAILAEALNGMPPAFLAVPISFR